MSIAAIKDRLANWREWEPNPIVVKELRQAVRSWTVTGMLLLFLVVLSCTSIGFLVSHLIDFDAEMGLGGSMFTAFMFILSGASVFFIPLYIGLRMGMERQENNPDLFYVSALSPGSIVRGKFLSGAYMALLFFSAVMPFMAFTNLLRGVDLPTVLFILFCLFLVVCAANMISIFLACLPVTRPFKVLLGLYGLFQSFVMIVPIISFSFGFMHSGVGAMLFGRSFWFAVATFVAVTLAVIGLFYFLAVALISPHSANRALAVRIYISVIWTCGGLLSFAWVIQTGSPDRILAWSYSTLALMVCVLLVIISNADRITSRVRRAIPGSKLARLAAFLFYNGAAGGLVWAAIIFIATFAVTAGVGLYASRGAKLDSEVQGLSVLMAYAFDYALLALFLQRKFLPNRPPKIAGILAIVLASIWAVAPSIVLFFLNKLTWKSVEGAQLGNPFSVLAFGGSADLLSHQYFAFGWLAVMIVLNARWFLRQAANFRPPPASAPPVIV